MTIAEKNSNRPVPIEELNSLDLDNHIIIEASAGTGKTYTLENVVVLLIEKGHINSIEDILIVTFTEKATGELRTRIRSRLEEKLLEENLDPVIKNKFQDSIDNYDLASIFTIHGFCNKVLQQYSYESGEQFRFDVLDDKLIYKQIIHKILRENWPASINDDLKTLVKISGFPSYNRGNKSSNWTNRVIEIAKKYNPNINDSLLPPVEKNLKKYLSDFIKTVTKYMVELKKLLGPIDINNPENSSTYTAYSTLNIKKNMLNKRLTIIKEIIQLFITTGKDEFDLQKIINYFTSSKLENFEILNAGWKKEGPDYEDKLPNLIQIIDILEKLRNLEYSYLINQLAVQTILTLKEEVAEFKKSNGFISYDDMISLVYKSIKRKDSKLVQVLQNKYKYALVDEFQDTDLMQWNIFKTIFLESKSSKLFIIGDPKQAIYGFRGADIFAYFTAREHMIESHGASYYTLNKNYRSSPGLIHVFNIIFSFNNWFLDEQIQYIENFYPENKTEKTIPRDTTDLCILNLGQCTGGTARKKMALSAANEIHSLLTETNIHPNEIAILVRKWTETSEIEKALTERGIPFSYYKKEGLFQGEEALHLRYLLSAIANPSNMSNFKKALLTDFFKIDASIIDKNDSIANYPEVQELIEKWINLSQQKDWSTFFHSIVEDTGIFYRLVSDKNEQPKIKNYQHIIQVISFESYKENFDIKMLNQFLSGLINGETDSTKSQNIQKIEFEDPGVQLLTIHASKGLQFDTVFIAGGFTSGEISDYDIYHDNNSRIISLVRSDKSKSTAKYEMDCEETRLFYVALTRAENKLFVPIYEPGSYGKSSAGILGTRLAHAINHLKSIEKIKIVNYEDGFTARTKIRTKQEKEETVKFPEILFIDEKLSFIDRKISLESFSSLKSNKSKQEISFEENLSPDPAIDEVEDIPERGEVGSDEIILPKGKNTGSMLHEIIEEIDFLEIHNSDKYEVLVKKDTPSFEIIKKKIEQYYPLLDDDLFNEYALLTANILWNTLKSPIINNNTSLSSLTNKLHELEFFFYLGEKKNNEIPDVQIDNNGFIRGFIDLIFHHEDKYYILDWKSNFIEEGYTPNLLTKNILSSSYDLQYKIYIIALVKWLKKINPGFDFEQHFGGVYYLYLRGMDYKDPVNGVYFYRPESEEEINFFYKKLL